VRSTINDFVQQLAPEAFARIHRRFSVNVNLIEDIFPNEISMQGVKLPIGKSYRDELFSSPGTKHA
jgi:DNA-binding LytR/AlgR family response regulator